MSATSHKRSIHDVNSEDDQPEDKSHKKAREDHDTQRNAPTTTPRSMRQTYPSVTGPSPRAPAFQYPNQLITFSYTPERVLEFNDSAKRYYVDPPRGADLGFRYETWVKRPEERGRLDSLLQACLKDQAKLERRRASVVSWRGVMTKILTAPYEERDGWELNVMRVNGTMYLEEHSNDAKLRDKEQQNPRQRQQTYYGYAFESYSTSSTPNPADDMERLPNGWSGDVNTNVQWCNVVKTKLGDLRLIIGGEVDCVRESSASGPSRLVELKTSMTIRGQQDELRFEKKLLKFYFQSFLLGVPEIVVGFRTPSGKVTDLQSFKTIEIPRLVRGKPSAWDPNLCLKWGADFLQFANCNIDTWPMDSSLEEASDKPTDEVESSWRRVWRVKFAPRTGVEMTLLDDAGVEEVKNGEDRVGFLPTSYWEELLREHGAQS